ncbi:MAG: WD40/YVTN/BNR-like repeat-containing protein, partial [Bacteroidota bacterium]
SDLVKKGEITPLNLVEYTEDANSALFDAPVHGLEVYRSDDLGKSWKLTHEKGYLENVHFTYGYYFAQIRAANPDQLYVLGVPVLRSDNGGKTWKSINGDNVHSDHHALWVNPKKPGHLILGNDGGINISYDNGETWIKCNTPSLGQFYHVAVDMAEPYRVYGG